ncbi:hypothetical protein DFJ73DRAFT_796025 [Zopfochytrium polystomum]|nr:hypothetical protein DFJ73DRAFT_796025 [Zopfochytrium polystomum]
MSVAAAPDTIAHEDVSIATSSQQKTTRLIAIAVDGSKHSEYAFKWAIDNLIRAESDQVLLINTRTSIPDAWKHLLTDVEAAERNESHELLRKYASTLPPADTVAWKVEKENVDILVVGSRGLGPISRTVMGSVSDYLVRHLKIPVMVIKGGKDEKK